MSRQLPFYIREDDPPAKREILRAAMKLFSKKGFAATTIRDIARESGYTNPALYKHFSSKQQLALRLFETCHTRVWSSCAGALASRDDFAGKLDAYVRQWLELVDDHPEVIAFLSDSARVLWPKAGPTVRSRTVIGLARSLVLEASKRRRASAIDPDLGAACIEGTLAELARMIEVGVVKGPAARWKDPLVAQFRRLVS